MEDHQIIALFEQRSEEAVDAAARKYGAYCRAIADNILRSPEDAEECVSDTWLAAWNSIPPQKPKYLSVFLGRITRNSALNRLKLLNAQKRGGGTTEAVLDELAECIPAQGGVEEAFDEILLKEAIDSFLRSQPEQKRRVFIRRYWAMEPVGDIAKAFGLRRGQVATMLYRMRQELKEHLEKEGITI